ncbi:MAG: carbonic anhydrase, partial [Streptomyces sp.]|nr:carbonic anhydrase [Streptomyces sp.]
MQSMIDRAHYVAVKAAEGRQGTHRSAEVRPQTLFITCTDFHVIPSRMVSAHPHKLFELRNIGNVVPPYQPDVISGEIATIEFALSEQSIRDIVVCGHSRCGAVAALLDRPGVAVPAAVRRWMAVARSRAVSRTAAGTLAAGPRDGQAWDRAARAHLVTQYAHLAGYPTLTR